MDPRLAIFIIACIIFAFGNTLFHLVRESQVASTVAIIGYFTALPIIGAIIAFFLLKSWGTG